MKGNDMLRKKQTLWFMAVIFLAVMILGFAPPIQAAMVGNNAGTGIENPAAINGNLNNLAQPANVAMASTILKEMQTTATTPSTVLDMGAVLGNMATRAMMVAPENVLIAAKETNYAPKSAAGAGTLVVASNVSGFSNLPGWGAYLSTTVIIT